MTRQFRRNMTFSAQTLKLAGTYLTIIMVMSIGFSLVFYQVSTKELDRPLSPQIVREIRENTSEDYEQSITELTAALELRSIEAQQALLERLVLLNILAFVGGGVLSYVLARLSLRPIEENIEAQGQFVSDASHELRTPLTIIQTTNEVALRKKKITEKEVRSLLSYNVEEAKKLQNLSNSLLELLKNHTKAHEVTRVDIQNVVSRSMEYVVAQAQEKDITIDDHTPQLSVSTNPELLVRLISILLDNAVKYSEDAKTITISAKESGSHIIISVADEGIGIRESDLKYVFRRFYRADKSRSKISADVDGYGLGLSLAEKIAHQLDAKLSVESEFGKGSVFSITLNSSAFK